LNSNAIDTAMLNYAVLFFVLGVLAAIAGFGGIAVGAVLVARALFFVFLVLFVGSLIWGLVHRNL
jgi:uncharacterized membrane protein YtjA (UPF0391 family)